MSSNVIHVDFMEGSVETARRTSEIRFDIFDDVKAQTCLRQMRADNDNDFTRQYIRAQERFYRPKKTMAYGLSFILQHLLRIA